VQNRALDDLPESLEEVEKLARRLGYEPQGDDTAAERFLADLEKHTSEIRAMFLQLLEREKNRGLPKMESPP
jgi:hypothetical protein